MIQKNSDLGNKITSLISGKRRRIIAIIAILAISGFIMANSFNGSNESSNSSEFNRADVMFMNMMVVHHDQAIEMAELADDRTDNENVLELSKNISEAQNAENKQMASWLRELGYQRPVRGHRMAGMASQSQMEQLRNSNGTEFDNLFAELMITHHQGGIQMAQNFVDQGRNPELKEMQKGMIETQQREIELMREWLRDWN